MKYRIDYITHLKTIGIMLGIALFLILVFLFKCFLPIVLGCCVLYVVYTGIYCHMKPKKVEENENRAGDYSDYSLG